MIKVSTREKILNEGLRLVHEHGFAGASVRDIVQAAGVPQGSFTNHFVSKEAFGLEVIDLYFVTTRENIGATLLNDALPPLERLGLYLDQSRNRLNNYGMRRGCLLGNFTAETCNDNDAMRFKLMDIYKEVEDAYAYCLRAAVAAGELRADFPCEEIAAFILASVQGANLLAKAERTPAPAERFKKILFETILH